MRELSDAPNEVTFLDKISGEKMTHYFRTPTTQERIKYGNGFVTRQGNQIVSTLGELRFKAGNKIYTGFKRGAFGIPAKGPVTIAGLSRATACVVSWPGHGLLTGDKVEMDGIMQAEWSALNGKHTIARISDDALSIPFNSAGFAADYAAGADPGTIKGKLVISSKPGEPNYEPAWKSFVQQYAPDVIEAVAVHAFEASVQRVANPAGDQIDVLPPQDDWEDESGDAPEEAVAGKEAAGLSPLS